MPLTPEEIDSIDVGADSTNAGGRSLQPLSPAQIDAIPISQGRSFQGKSGYTPAPATPSFQGDLADKIKDITDAQKQYESDAAKASLNGANLEIDRHALDLSDPQAVTGFNQRADALNKQFKDLDAAHGDIIKKVDDYKKLDASGGIYPAPPQNPISVVGTAIRNFLSPFLGPTEAQKSQDMIQWHDANGNTTYAYKPLASKAEQQGILPAASGVVSSIAKTPAAVGQDAINALVPGSSDEPMENTKALSAGEPLPREQTIDKMGGVAKLYSKILTVDVPDILGKAETAGMLNVAGLPHAAATAIAFGTSEHGVDPVGGLVVAGIGMASKYGQDFGKSLLESDSGKRFVAAALGKPTKILSDALKEPNGMVKLVFDSQYRGQPWLTPELVQQTVKTIGGVGAVNLYLDAVATAQAAMGPKDQFVDTVKAAYQDNLALSALALPEVLNPDRNNARAGAISQLTPEQKENFIRITKVLNKGTSLGNSPEGEVFRQQAHILAQKYGFDFQGWVPGTSYDPNVTPPAPLGLNPPPQDPNAPQNVPNESSVQKQPEGVNEVGKAPAETSTGGGVPSPAGQPAETGAVQAPPVVPTYLKGYAVLTKENGEALKAKDIDVSSFIKNPLHQITHLINEIPGLYLLKIDLHDGQGDWVSKYPRLTSGQSLDEHGNVKGEASVTLSKGDEIPVTFDGLWPGTQMPVFTTTAPVVSPESGKVQPVGSKITGALIGKYGLTVPPAEQVKAEAAVKSAISPNNPPSAVPAGAVEANPTPAQKEAGNYKMAHIDVQGLPITVENPAGSIRSKHDENGKELFSVKMPADYGYIKKTEAGDGDHVDVYVGPNHASQSVYVVNQHNPATGKFDESKVMLGFDTQPQAIMAYDKAFSDGSGPTRRKEVIPTTITDFKSWLDKGDTTKPFPAPVVQKPKSARSMQPKKAIAPAENPINIASGKAEPETVTNKGARSLAKPNNLPHTIRYTIRPNGRFDISAQGKEGLMGMEGNLTREQLNEKVGKEMAEKIASHQGDQAVTDVHGYRTGSFKVSELQEKLFGKPNEKPSEIPPAKQPETPAKPVENAGVSTTAAPTAPKVTVTDNSVRDLPQQVVIEGDTIKVIHKVGRQVAGGFSFPLSEWQQAAKGPSANPNYNYAQVIQKYTKGLDEQPGGDGQAQRIRDSIVRGIHSALDKSTPLPAGATQIDASQANAIVGGVKRLLPSKGETKPQPQDSTGEYFIGQTKDGRFFTQQKPKVKNEPTQRIPPSGEPQLSKTDSVGGGREDVQRPSGLDEEKDARPADGIKQAGDVGRPSDGSGVEGATGAGKEQSADELSGRANTSVSEGDNAAQETAASRAVVKAKELGGAVSPTEKLVVKNEVETLSAAVKADEAKSSLKILSTASVVKIKAPVGATMIRATMSNGKTAIQPLTGKARITKGDNVFKGVEITKLEAGTIGKAGKFVPMEGRLIVKDALLKNAAESPVVAISKVEKQIDSVVKTEGQRPAKEVKNELIERLELAFKTAKTDIDNPKSADAKVTISIPGDGSFTIVNTKDAIGEVLDRARKLNTNSGGVYKPRIRDFQKNNYKTLEFSDWTDPQVVPAIESRIKESKERKHSGPEVSRLEGILEQAKRLRGNEWAAGEAIDDEAGSLTGSGKRMIAESAAVGPEGIRELVNDSKNGLDAATVKVINAMLETRAFKNADWSTLRLELTNRMKGGVAGSAIVSKNLIKLSGEANPETFPHEFFHLLYEFLPRETRDAIYRKRMQALEKIYGSEIPQSFRRGMTTAEFDKSGIPLSQYPLINTGEFFSEFASKRFTDDILGDIPEGDSHSESWWRNLKAMVRRWVDALVKILRRIAKGPDMEDAYRDLLNGKYKATPEGAMTNEEEQASLARSPEEYNRKRALGEVGTAEGTVAAYGTLARIKYDTAKNMGASDRTMAILNIPKQRQLADLGFSHTALDNYYDVRAKVAGSSPALKTEVALSAYHALSIEQHYANKIADAATKQRDYLTSPKFLKMFARLSLNDVKVQALAGAETTFRLQAAQMAADAVEALGKVAANDARYAALKQQASRMQAMPQYSKDVADKVQAMVAMLSSHPTSLNNLLYGTNRSGTDLANKFFSMSTAAGNTITDPNERAFYELAGQVLAVNRDVARTLSLVGFAKANPQFTAQMTAAGQKFAARMEKDPKAAISALIKAAQRKTEARTNAEAAWMILHNEVEREIDKYIDQNKAVEVQQALDNSPEYRKLINDVHQDVGEGTMRYPDQVIKDLTATDAFNEFESAPVFVSPDGNTYKIDLGFTKGDAIAAQTEVGSYLREVEAWLANPFNKDAPDRRYWESRRDFVESVYYVSTTSRPSSITPFDAKILPSQHSWWIPDFLFDQLNLPAAKVTRVAFENFGAGWLAASGWCTNKQDRIVNAIAVAARSHGYSAIYDMKDYQTDFLNQMGYKARTGETVSVGDVMDNGMTLNSKDIEAFKIQGKAISDLFNKIKNAGREKFMTDRLLVDEFAANVFGVRSPRELGGEEGTTLPHDFSERGKVLSRIITKAIENGASENDTISLLDQSNNFEFVQLFLAQRKSSFVQQLSPFEEQYKELALKTTMQDPTAPKSVKDVIDYIEANSLAQYTRDEIQTTVVTEMTGRLAKFYDKFVKPVDSNAVRAFRTETASSLSRGFVADVENSFFYDYGVVTAPDVRALATDASNYHLVRIDKALDSLENAMVLALDPLNNAPEKKAFLKGANKAFHSGEDFRDFERLQSQLNQVRDFKKMLPSWAGNNTTEAALINRGSRIVGDIVSGSISGITTSLRVLIGSNVKSGQVFRAMDRSILHSTVKGIASMGMSFVKVGGGTALKSVGRLVYNSPGAFRQFVITKGGVDIRVAESIRTLLEGVTEDVMRPSKYLRDQYELGLIVDGMLGVKIANMIMMPTSKGHGYAPGVERNSVMRWPAQIGNIILTAKELPLELFKTYFPQLSYNIAYDAAARQAGWTLDVLERQARRAFDVMEKTGTLGRYNLNNLNDPRNVLLASQVLPSMLVKKTQTSLALTRDWFRAIDHPYDETVLSYWKRLSQTPKNQRKSIRMLSADELDPLKAPDLLQRRMAALMAVSLKDVHHASPTNSSWLIRAAPGIRIVSPFLRWSSQTTRQYSSIYGQAPYDPERSQGMLKAITYIMLAVGFGIQILIGDSESRLHSMVSWAVNNEKSSVKHLGEGESFWENAKIGLDEGLGYISQLNGIVNTILGVETGRGGNSFQAVLEQQLNGVLQLIHGFEKTGDPTYGLLQFLSNQDRYLKPFVNRMPSQEGLVADRNIKSLFKKYGPEDLQRQSGFGIPVPTPLSPYKEALANAVFTGDPEKIKTAYDAFVQKATDIGRNQPEKLAQQVFESLNPYHQVFGGALTDEQRQTMMGRMTDGERQIVENVESKYKDAAAELSFRAAFTKEEANSEHSSGGSGTPSGQVPDFTNPLQQGLRSAGARGTGGVGGTGPSRGIGGITRAGSGGRSFSGRYGRVGSAKPRASRGLVRGTGKGTGRGSVGRRPRSISIGRGTHP